MTLFVNKSLLDLRVVRSEPDLRQTAMVSLASFFRMACIDRLSAQSRFPSQYLNMSREEVWPQRLVARLAVEIRQGESGDRSAALSALNILGHPSLIPVVIPLIEGKVKMPIAIESAATIKYFFPPVPNRRTNDQCLGASTEQISKLLALISWSRRQGVSRD